MSDLGNRTARALEACDKDSYASLLHEWVGQDPLLSNLVRSRALVGRLLEDQKGMIGALSVGIDQTARFPDDGPMQTFKQIAEKRIAAAVQVP